MENTRVKFYIKNNEVIAFFPDIEWSEGTKMCYAHIGQHSACDPSYVKKAKRAKPANYAPLMQELKDIGYNLDVI
jgi:hypothetical protein